MLGLIARGRVKRGEATNGGVALAGVILGVLSWFASGGLGPGRLADVGPNPWAVGLWAALEIGVAATIGVLASGKLPTRRR